DDEPAVPGGRGQPGGRSAPVQPDDDLELGVVQGGEAPDHRHDEVPSAADEDEAHRGPPSHERAQCRTTLSDRAHVPGQVAGPALARRTDLTGELRTKGGRDLVPHLTTDVRAPRDGAVQEVGDLVPGLGWGRTGHPELVRPGQAGQLRGQPPVPRAVPTREAPPGSGEVEGPYGHPAGIGDTSDGIVAPDVHRREYREPGRDRSSRRHFRALATMPG